MLGWSSYGRTPTVVDVISVLSTSIQSPYEASRGKGIKPKTISVLQTRQCSEATVSSIGKSLKGFGITLKLKESLTASELEIVEASSKKADPKEQNIPLELSFIRDLETGSSNSKLSKPPSSICIDCRKEIDENDMKICPKCRAVQFCSDCAEKTESPHNNTCATFAGIMAHAIKLKANKFPFTFYTDSDPLMSYNVVPFLIENGFYNKGLWKCYSKNKFLAIPSGAITASIVNQMMTSGSKNDRERFAIYNLPETLFPLNKKLDIDLAKLDSWEAYYKAKELPMSDPSAVLLEVPLTIWYMVQQFVLPQKPRFNKNGQREIVVHVAGAEKECDLALLFEMLLPLLPKTSIAIHMISPRIPPDLPPPLSTIVNINQESNSILLATNRHGAYSPDFHSGEAYKKAGLSFGTEKPDLVLLLNAGVPFIQQWEPSLRMLISQKQPTVITENFEFAAGLTAGLLNKLGAPLQPLSEGKPIGLNPFRQPVFSWSPETRFPSYSNAFMVKIF